MEQVGADSRSPRSSWRPTWPTRAKSGTIPKSCAREKALPLRYRAPRSTTSTLTATPTGKNGFDAWIELAAARLAAALARLERLGIIDEDGNLTSSELPADMLPDSDTTLD